MLSSLGPQTAWLCTPAWLEIKREADASLPLETGGVLLGFWSPDSNEPVATHVVGPGPNGVHREDGFIPDYDFQEREIATLYEESGRRLSYLGDWHTHPGGSAHMSRRDRACLRRIARHPEARVVRPLMLVLAGGDPWKPTIWQGESRRRWFWRIWSVQQLQVAIGRDSLQESPLLGGGHR